MLSVELLYLLESVVELCKLVWSWDGCKFVSPHSVRQIITTQHEKNNRKLSGQQQSGIHPWTFQDMSQWRCTGEASWPSSKPSLLRRSITKCVYCPTALVWEQCSRAVFTTSVSPALLLILSRVHIQKHLKWKIILMSHITGSLAFVFSQSGIRHKLPHDFCLLLFLFSRQTESLNDVIIYVL